MTDGLHVVFSVRLALFLVASSKPPTTPTPIKLHDYTVPSHTQTRLHAQSIHSL